MTLPVVAASGALKTIADKPFGELLLIVLVVGFLGSLAGLVTGRMPAGLRNLGAFCIGYVAQADAYWLVVTDAYPRLSQEREPPARPEPV